MARLCMLLVCLVLTAFATKAEASYYVGSEQCFSCHPTQFNEWQASGHPWKVRKAEKARYSGIPLPPGYTWDDIAYVIGGAIKKARFIGQDGYIITTAKDGSEAKTQYNLSDGTWAFYHKGEKKPYKCGPCHMTNYSPEGNQDGRPGLIGTWVEDGVGCEECHGPGSDHTKAPAASNIKVVVTAEACGKCHQRGGMDPKPPAKGGFIKHHEQINELSAGAHAEMNCMNCHNPHQRAILANKDICASCHEEIAAAFAKTNHAKAEKTCITCHMPFASKSAIKINRFTGDVRTHLFKINVDPNANMFVTEEKDGKKSTYAKGFVTLDYVCLSCHMSRDKQWAAKEAKKVHN